MKRLYSLLALATLSVASVSASKSVLTGGSMHSVAVNSEGDVYAWGRNLPVVWKDVLPALGLDTTWDKVIDIPQKVIAGDVKFAEVTAGSADMIVALSDKGVVYTWGASPDTLIQYPSPVLKPSGWLGFTEDGNAAGDYLGFATSVAASTYSGYALLKTGEVVSWGSEAWNDSTSVFVPAFIKTKDGSTLKNVKYVTGGDQSALFLTKDGDLYMVGDVSDEYNGNKGRKYAVRVVKDDGDPLTDVVDCAAGDLVAYAVTSDGSVWAWGSYLGLATLTNAKNPIRVKAGEYGEVTGLDYLTNAKEVVGGRGYGMALMKDRTVTYWGSMGSEKDDHLSFGIPPFSLDSVDSKYNNSSAVMPSFAHYCDEEGNEGKLVDDAVYVGRGDNFGFLINLDYQAFAFGVNNYGQTGTGLEKERINCFSPISIPKGVMKQPAVSPYGELSDAYICEGDSAVLDCKFDAPAGREKEYAYRWTKDGDTLPFNTPSITVADEGLYSLTIEYVGNETLTDSASYVVDAEVAHFPTPLDLNMTVRDDDFLGFVMDVNEMYYSAKDSLSFNIFRHEDDTQPIDRIENIGKRADFYAAKDSFDMSFSAEGDTIYTVWVEDDTKFETEVKIEKPISEKYSNYFGRNWMCVLIRSERPTTLNSFTVYVKSIFGVELRTITPLFYEYIVGDYPYNSIELITEGTPKEIECKDEASEFVVECGFHLEPGHIYALSMEMSSLANVLCVAGDLKSNSSMLVSPIEDNNGMGVSVVGYDQIFEGTFSSSRPSENCFFDLKFSVPTDYFCGRFPLSVTIPYVEATSISTIENAKEVSAKGVYTIDGKYLGEDLDESTLIEGIYIINGVKRVIKR